MKIAIASLNQEINSEISPQAGRAPYYLFFENGKLIETFKNPFVHGSGGAGLSIAKVLKDKAVNKVIAGKFGDKMINALKEAQIEVIETEGRIKDNMLQ